MNEKIILKAGDFEAFIFDMDGLLLDTEKICWECFKKACSIYNYEPDFERYKVCLGKKPETGDLHLAESFKGLIPFDKVKPEWSRIYHDAIENGPVPLKPGIINLLSKIRHLGKKTAVATSTDFKLAEKKLQRSNILHYFDTVTAGDMVTNSKPDPEIYLKTAALLGAEPSRCIAFEDSDAGATAAFKAGMKVIQIVDLLEPSAHVIEFGHTIIRSAEQIVLE